jgi:glucose/arabinose dehydrogenase
MIFDHRDDELSEALRTSFLADHQIDVDQSFGHLSLVSVVNDFAATPNNQITLDLVARVNHVVTDIAVLPDGESFLVATKKGEVQWVDLAKPESNRLVLNLNQALDGLGEIYETGESGLIGLALHPRYPEVPAIYLHYNLDLADGRRVARVASWMLDADEQGPSRASSEAVILDIPQPETNHNGGALRFGEDGSLYIAIGDGEDGEWVKGRSPASSLRGKVLRIDIDRRENGHAYAIPSDNPFIDDSGFPPETWAWGFRNPWRIAFAPDGRLLAGDVGEDRYEEITEVVPGRHHGWPEMEGDWCRLEDRCDPKTSVPPLFHYGRDDGMSVTGGEVYEGASVGNLKGHYIFADFSSGRLWALPLSAGGKQASSDQVTELGRWTVEFTTFAKAPDGELYVGDLRGKIYRLAPPANQEDVDS